MDDDLGEPPILGNPHIVIQHSELLHMAKLQMISHPFIVRMTAWADLQRRFSRRKPVDSRLTVVDFPIKIPESS